MRYSLPFLISISTVYLFTKIFYEIKSFDLSNSENWSVITQMLVKQESSPTPELPATTNGQQPSPFGSAEALQTELERMLAQISRGGRVKSVDAGGEGGAETAAMAVEPTAADSDDLEEEDDEDEEEDITVGFGN
jgi:hypothetical protein